ncbi:DUF3825 domain-containing protein [Ellagibacter isourolithinifaciens]|uniref:DUF3825 domain-containing protein n=1 Tax=Ellagibacter isourolithinifaciens TaxID=2137581 RepID=A0A6N6NQ48_9ACTN|nr:DUF3825 domain-containing protein [Ellagibacter isourolithinifaciens]KAB1641590.1 DUF3825 domain-containing protein [Ellagibacter isourolithinifaciens]
MAFYWEEPSKLIFDSRKELIANVEHIIQDNRNRFPEPYSGQTDYQLQIAINGSIEAAKERFRRNYRLQFLNTLLQQEQFSCLFRYASQNQMSLI